MIEATTMERPHVPTAVSQADALRFFRLSEVVRNGGWWCRSCWAFVAVNVDGAWPKCHECGSPRVESFVGVH